MSQDSRTVPANRCTVPLSVEVAPALDASSRSHLQSHLQSTAWSSNFFKRLPRWQKRFIRSSVQNVHPKTRCSRCLSHFTPNASPCREIRSHQAKSSTRLFNESAYLSPHYFPVQYILSNYMFDTSPYWSWRPIPQACSNMALKILKWRRPKKAESCRTGAARQGVSGVDFPSKPRPLLQCLLPACPGEYRICVRNG